MAIAEKLKTESYPEQLARLEAEVEALRHQLRRAQRLATVGTMTAMVVHEFNNILTPIINYAQLARKNPAMVDKAISSAADGGKRACTICKAILGMTRAGDAEPVETSLAELVHETLAVMGRELHRDGIDLRLEIPADLTITTHRIELQQVLLNLLINARTAVLSQDGPRRIEMSAEHRKQNVIIRLSDSGEGIPPENLEKIFEPFFTTKGSTDDDSRGHGLGLAMCREIITGMGGRISVQSTQRKGTTFTLHLPD